MIETPPLFVMHLDFFDPAHMSFLLLQSISALSKHAKKDVGI